MQRAKQIIEELGLRPHPEGGYYREIYLSSETSRRSTAKVSRPALSVIYFLLVAGQHSRWHQFDATEVWHFIEGEPLLHLAYNPRTEGLSRTLLGPSHGTPQELQPAAQPKTQPGPASPQPNTAANSRATALAFVPAYDWQAAGPLGSFCLVSCSVAPAFDFESFSFVSDLPEHKSVFEKAPMNGFREWL